MLRPVKLILPLLLLQIPAAQAFAHADEERRWLAGDHHVHGIYSANYPADPENPDAMPEPVIGGDSPHTTLQNAQMARRFGLDWMVTTDHGGPNHSHLNYTQAWPEVVATRAAVPDLVLFYGMEFDVPGGEHATLILPIDPAEREMLRQIESGFAKREAFPNDPARNTKQRMLDALEFMAEFPDPPIIIANHPSRTATGPAEWGLHSPAEFRQWHETAPEVAIGMEGAPGHQATGPIAGTDTAPRPRGLYGRSPTLGGFDQMVATLGGGWDALLGQGLRWTITANSDSHRHWSAGGADFWQGEYAKTFVLATPTSADIMDGLRSGRVFVAMGGLIDQLDFTATVADAPARTASLGDSLAVSVDEALVVTIRFRPARTANAAGLTPMVDHIDLIAGDVTGQAGDHNPTARVVHRFTAADWQSDGDSYAVQHRMEAGSAGYLRLRGSNTGEGEPAADPADENPWNDLWFYSNPIYLGR